MASEMERLCKAHAVTIRLMEGNTDEGRPSMDGMRPWTVALYMHGRRLVVNFWTGAAIARPTAADVLACLMSDATSYEGAQGFEAWCADMDLDTDSRAALHTYEECGRLAVRLRAFLGEFFDEFANAEH